MQVLAIKFRKQIYGFKTTENYLLLKISSYYIFLIFTSFTLVLHVFLNIYRQLARMLDIIEFNEIFLICSLQLCCQLHVIIRCNCWNRRNCIILLLHQVNKMRLQWINFAELQGIKYLYLFIKNIWALQRVIIFIMPLDLQCNYVQVSR